MVVDLALAYLHFAAILLVAGFLALLPLAAVLMARGLGH